MFGKKKKNENEEDIIDVDATDLESKDDESTDDVDKVEENNIESKEEPKKEKKTFKLFQTFNVYKFIVKIVATILLITLGILILVNQDNAIFSLFIITGGVTLFQAVIRAFFLFKKTRNRKAKIVTAVELALEFLLGLFFIFAAIAKNSVTKAAERGESTAGFAKNFSNFADEQYPVFSALIFYVGAMSYFWRTILYKDETDQFKFWLNFVLITGAVVLLAFRQDLTAKIIAIIVAVMSFLSALVIGGEATGGYIQYRKRNQPAKEDKKKEQEGIEAPAKDDKKEYDDIDPNAIPREEPNTDTDIIS
ncbi:MAG: hypothetical protein IKP77_00525 [Acholeplasmatales bacterium]|nr:hypothetical protein [Acholeplasmatales bacterium]